MTKIREIDEQNCGPARGRYRNDVANSPFGERVRNWILEHNVEHLHGPETIDHGPDEVVVLVIVRNGRPYIETFIEHYFRLGAKHIVFLDNGSTDGTVATLRGYEKVTVLRSELPYKYYNIPIKRYLVERFGRGRWTLSVDMDELFDYPYSDVVSLKTLLRYLNENSYTAVVCHMLDMFSDRPLSKDEAYLEDVSLKDSHRLYDLSDVRTHNYHNNLGEIGNVLANEEIRVLQGGPLSRLFGINPWLTKHPLVFLDDRLKPMDLSDHWAGNARVADFTGILLHYKILNNLYEVVRLEMEERRYFKPGKYDKLSEVLEKSPSLSVESATSRKLGSVNELVGTRLVSVSEQYMRFVESEGRRTGQRSADDWAEGLSEAFFNAGAEVAACNDDIDQLRQQLFKLREEKKAAAQKARKAEQLLATRAQNAEEKVRAVQRQIHALHSSNGWKALTALARTKAHLSNLLGRPGNRAQG